MLDAVHVKRVLEQMKAEDPNHRVFGATTHKYRMGSVLPERKIREFEEKHGVRLPEDYRHFLTTIGNGVGIYGKKKYDDEAGAGPDYGLTPFRRASKYSRPDKPFLWKSTDARPGGIYIYNHSHNEDGEYRPPGVIQLCEQGCTGYFYLVVHGESYGTVWKSWEYDFYPTGLSFEEWYRNWLDRLVETATPILRRERVVEQVEPGMSKAEIVAICGGEWKQDEYCSSWQESTLSSSEFVTQFKLDADNRVKRIIAHSIYIPHLRR